MRCAAIDIGSNTTRVLVAGPGEGQLHAVMERRAYTRIAAALTCDGAIEDEKVVEVAEVVSAQLRLAQELGAEAVRVVATAAIRESSNRDAAVAAISEACRHRVEVLSARDEGRLAFIGATGTLGHPVEGSVGVVDVGGGSSEVVLGGVGEGTREVTSFRIGSGSLSDRFLDSDPPAPAEIRAVREHIAGFFQNVELEQPDSAIAVGGSATSLRAVAGAVLDHETLERAVRVLVSERAAELAKRFELDPRRVRLLPSGVLLLEKLSELLRRPLEIGRGGLREGIILDLLGGASNGATSPAAA